MSKEDQEYYWNLHDAIYNSFPVHEPEASDLDYQNLADKVFEFVKGYPYIHEKYNQ